ncbi:potassium/proton antiporter [Mesorhizobium sp.]|jgi:cell volume regulation protein A|uniref:potassium/proton antiporter n=1 Tax=Mesorhizobium sp. TaxID=1871066 RepID=UPI000FEA00D5|nr:potassium/proton antiporter [Mesorhizobium sp.]RWO92216.1 MAG: potassium/proton antiporter [Mesorhizobium sp.]RWQ58016.1 MAG: potassium/proton antiporter [Mesorhizobium sp.]
MEHAIYLVTLVGAALVVAAAFSSLIAFRFGAPLLLLFLCIGLATGTDGLGIQFDNARLAYFAGSLALAVILFDSGFGTPLNALRQAAGPALSLATVGVLLTTGLFGAVAHYLLDLSWLESFLLGAAVASTDAAAVFFLLRAGEINLRERVRSTLEVESGTNDPIAIFLTISLVEIIAANASPEARVLVTDLVLGFLFNMGLGAVVGIFGGLAIVRLVDRLNLDHGLLPIFVLTLSLMVFAAAGAIGGSGFLAVYLAGLIAGNSDIRAVTILKRFQDGMSWLAQIIMFLILGLFATPSQFPAILLPAVLLGLFLIFVARPIAVWLCLMPFRLPRPEVAFVSWVGLRGAVSILLAITPLLGGLENGRLIFNTAFIVVLVSLVIQGWTVGPLARRLGLIVPARLGPLDKVELELPGSAHHELLAYRVAPGSPVARGERIPRWARPSLVLRDGRSMRFQDMGRLAAGDHVYIFVPDRYPALLDKLFASRAVVDPEDADFFGAFAVDPARSAAELEAAYAPGLTEEERKLTVGDLVTARLGGHAEYADRVLIGPIELIVRDVDDKGRITGLGLSLEPTAPVARVPVFLSAGEIADRIVGFVRNWRKRTKKPGAEAPDDAEPAPQPVMEKTTGEG